METKEENSDKTLSTAEAATILHASKAPPF